MFSRYFSMELCSVSLDQCFASGIPCLPTNEKFLFQLASGLEYIHSKGHVHGSIKPSNILLVSSYSDCSYYIVDLTKQEEFFLCKGFSPYAMGSHKFPSYNFEDFPYILAKEDDYMTIVHVRAGFSLRLCSIPTHN